MLSTLAAARTGKLLAAGRGTAEALVGGYRLAFGVGVGLLVAAIVVAVVVLRDGEAAEPALAEPEEDQTAAEMVTAAA